MVSSITTSPTRLFEINLTNISQPLATIRTRGRDEPWVEEQLPVADQAAAVVLLLERLADIIPVQNITAVGHRIVHGGTVYTRPVQITDTVEHDLTTLTKLDQQHTPAALELIHHLRQALPSALHVACFDTAFFHDVPRLAQIVPIPRRFEAQGVRRYGFHGLSYSYLLSSFEEQAGIVAAHGRIIMAHMGSGVSLAALNDGRPVDMTMGLTPTSGVMMSTRTGDLDPNVAPFLQQQTGMSLQEYDHMVNFESGLLGVSDLSSDMYTLLEAMATNPQAAEAVELFCYQIQKAIGALATTIGGLDSLIFTGGIGEQADRIRTRICAGLGFMGIQLDEEANRHHAFLISASPSRVGVHVLPTDEALQISRQVYATFEPELTRG